MLNKGVMIAVHQTLRDEETNYSFRWLKRLKDKKVEHIVVDMKSDGVLNKITDCSGVMWHWNHTPFDKISACKILDTVEVIMKKRVFPNYESRWHFDEKISQYYLLKSLSAPMVDTKVFWNEDEALGYIEVSKYPMVFKLSVGAGSSNVLKLDSKDMARKYVKKMFDSGIVPYSMNEYGNLSYIRRLIPRQFMLSFYKKYPIFDYFLLQKGYTYLQEYLPNSYDIRVTVIGGRAFCFTRMNRNNDFRASGSGKIVYDQKKIPVEAVQIALDVSKRCGFQSMAYDFLLDGGGKPKISEISYCYKNSAVYNCPGYWDEKLVWHAGHNWPEDLMVDDFVSKL